MNCAGNVTEGSKESSSVSDEQGKTARYFIGENIKFPEKKWVL